MFDINLEDCRHFCDDQTYRMKIDVIFTKGQLFHHFENLDRPRIFIQSLYQQVETHNPRGGATHCELAYVIRGWVGNYMSKYVDNFNIENKDLKYIFRPGDTKKAVGVTFLISIDRLRYLALKQPEFYNKIRPNQLVQEIHQ